jgi:hypothetical protein
MRDNGRIGSVVVLSPDTDFEVTYKGLSTTASMRSVRPAYAAVGEEVPGKFLWLYDEKGRWRDDVWARWLEQDPVVMARRDASVFSPDQRIYLDGAERDEFKAQLGAKALKEALLGHPAVEFYESLGGHRAYLEERLARGLEWVFGRPVRKISGR